MRAEKIAHAVALVALAIGSAAVIAVDPVAAQEITPIALGPVLGSHPYEFTGITSLRELSDGRVIVTDPEEDRVVVLDFVKGTSKAIGRKGRGPEEYGWVAPVFDIGADSSIMADWSGGRFLLFRGDSIVETVPPDDPGAQATGRGISGADRLGNVVVRRRPTGGAGVTVTGNDDSAAVVLISRATGRSDTIAKLRLAAIRTERGTNSEGRVNSVFSRPVTYLPSNEEAVLLSDGTLAVARLEPFRVDLRAPDGSWIHGEPLPVPRIRSDARERSAFIERNSVPRGSSGPPSPFPPAEPPPAADFPEFLPPFNFRSKPIAGPRGVIFIKRARSADYTQSHYFVIDRNARLVGEITLPANEQIEGAGEGTVYVSYKDDVDILHIRRHAWP